MSNERSSSGLPPIKKSWRVNSLNLRSRNLIHQTYKDIPVVRLEYYEHIAHGAYKRIYYSIELALTLGINVVQSDYDVMLGFEDEIQAYNFIRYCHERKIRAYLYIDELMISALGLWLYLKQTDKENERKRKIGSWGSYLKHVFKVQELEKKWRQQWQ